MPALMPASAVPGTSAFMQPGSACTFVLGSFFRVCCFLIKIHMYVCVYICIRKYLNILGLPKYPRYWPLYQSKVIVLSALEAQAWRKFWNPNMEVPTWKASDPYWASNLLCRGRFLVALPGTQVELNLCC